MICAGGFHPDLRLGDAIQALDELSAAMQEYDRLTSALATLGYGTIMLPKAPVRDRIAFVLAHITKP